MNKNLFIIFLLIGVQSFAQYYDPDRTVHVVEEKLANRLALYGINETETDYDVKIVVTGTGIKQSKAKPRLIRIPSASKVLLKTLIIERGKRPSYTYELELNDSLSRRAIRKPFESIKIYPKKQIMVYITDPCTTCDTIMSSLDNGKYIFRHHILSEKPDIKKQLESALRYTKTPLDSVTNPIISIAGTLHTTIDSYDRLLEVLFRDESKVKLKIENPEEEKEEKENEDQNCP